MYAFCRLSLLVALGIALGAGTASADPFWGGLFGNDHHHHDAAGHRVDDAGHHIDNFGNHSGYGVYDNDYYDNGYNNGYYTQPSYNYYPQQNYYTPTPNVVPFNGVGLVITNPSANSGPISYVVGGYSYTLQPGYTQTFKTAPSYTISFNKGQGLGDARYTITDGNRYHFVANGAGWDMKSGDYRPPVAAIAAVTPTPTPTPTFNAGSPGTAGPPVTAIAASDIVTDPAIAAAANFADFADSAPALQTVQKLEVAPVSFNPGDRIVISSRVADVKSGAQVIGKVAQAESFVVRQVRGPWLEIDVSVNQRGWIHARDVRLESGAQDEVAPVSAAPVQ